MTEIENLWPNHEDYEPMVELTPPIHMRELWEPERWADGQLYVENMMRRKHPEQFRVKCHTDYAGEYGPKTKLPPGMNLMEFALLRLAKEGAWRVNEKSSATVGRTIYFIR